MTDKQTWVGIAIDDRAGGYMASVQLVIDMTRPDLLQVVGVFPTVEDAHAAGVRWLRENRPELLPFLT